MSLELAADAWRPELDKLIDGLDLSWGHDVLDAGCGPGRVTRWLSSRVGRNGSVVGLDEDEGALAWAAWALQDLEDAGPLIELWQGDVQALPFHDARFDAAWCSSVLGYVSDPQAAMRELVRVVRPGGRVVIVSGDASRWMFLPISPDLERDIWEAESRAATAGHWGSGTDLHLGRRLFGLASTLPASSVVASTVVWERTAPLATLERRYLERALSWVTDPLVMPWLGDRWDECRRLFHADATEPLLLAPDLHVISMAHAVIITV